MTTTIPGATVKKHIDGVHHSIKLKTRSAAFNLRRIPGKDETYRCQITAKDLPGAFKNSGPSSFGWFLITRFPGRNAVTRPKDLIPMAGNAILMWPHLPQEEKTKCLEFLEKLIRQEIPRIEPAPR